MPKHTTPQPSRGYVDPEGVQLHVSIDDILPPIWRRLIISRDATLSDLHQILQAAFGWEDRQLYRFDIGGLCYGDLDLLNEEMPDDEPRAFDASAVRILDFMTVLGRTIEYVYDFGDNWLHTIRFETFSPLPKKALATCIGGERAVPPEDVGGVTGYMEMIRLLHHADLPDERKEQRRVRRWVGRGYHPDRFDLARAEKAVRRHRNSGCSD